MDVYTKKTYISLWDFSQNIFRFLKRNLNNTFPPSQNKVVLLLKILYSLVVVLEEMEEGSPFPLKTMTKPLPFPSKTTTNLLPFPSGARSTRFSAKSYFLWDRGNNACSHLITLIIQKALKSAHNMDL